MFLLLYCIWLILNGRITLEICLIGILVSAAVFLFTIKNLDYSLKKEIKLYKSVPYLIAYVGQLLIEIVKANMAVTKIIISKKKIKPVRVRFQVPLKSKFTKVLYANSITLTPGTITAMLDEEGYLVHCLSEEFAEGIDHTKILQILQKIDEL